MFETSPENWRDSSLLLPRETRRWAIVAQIGFISDTHGRADRARRAIDLLIARGAERIVHLGDVGSESVLDLLAGIPSLVVFGNCDDARSLARYAELLGIEVAHPSTIIEFKSVTARSDTASTLEEQGFHQQGFNQQGLNQQGFNHQGLNQQGLNQQGLKHQNSVLRVGMTHGHLESEVGRLFDAQIDILLHGHTHEIRDEVVQGVRVLNPGALHRARTHTVLLLDTSTAQATWLDVD